MTESQTSFRRTEAKILVSLFWWYQFSAIYFFCSSVSLFLELCVRFMTCHNYESDRDEYTYTVKTYALWGEHAKVFSYINITGRNIFYMLLIFHNKYDE